MPKRKSVELAGKKYIIVPYTGFGDLGIRTNPPVPMALVPLFDQVEDSLAGPLRRAQSFEQNLKLHGVAGLAALLRTTAGEVVGTPQGETKALSYEDKLAFPFVFFRGERREEFGIQPTSFRVLSRTEPRHHDRVLRQQARRERWSSRKIQIALAIARGNRLTLAQSRAAARHYGIASALVDFSFDPRVAAYFAHPRIADPERRSFDSGKTPVGIIYGLGFDDLQRCFPLQAFTINGPGDVQITFHLIGNLLEVPYLALDESQNTIGLAVCSIELPSYFANRKIKLHAIQVPSVSRIRAQQGVFLEVAGEGFEIRWWDSMRLWYLLDFLCEKWCFFRRDAQFEDLPAISTKALFPMDSLPLRVALWPRK
jgi:hypothetical protein